MKTMGAKMIPWAMMAILAAIPAPIRAEVETLPLPERTWSFDGPFGTFDRGAAQRGLQVYEQVCAACHSLKYVDYRDLVGIGYSNKQIAAIAAEKTVPFINADGDIDEKPAKANDRFVSPFANDASARAANGGALPPDLSLMIKARRGGADYMAALLEGYQDPPPDFTLIEGRYYNPYFPGHQIAMPPPLGEDMIEYADGTKATIEQMAHDVTTFLAWAADPTMEERKKTGFNVLAFLAVLTFLLYLLKRKIWSRLD